MFFRLPATARPAPLVVRRAVVATLGAAVLALTGARFSNDAALGNDSGSRLDETTLPGIGALVPDDQLDQRILGLELTGDEWTAATTELNDALFAHEDAQRRNNQARRDLAQTLTARLDTADDLRRAETLAGTVDEQISALEALLQKRAVALFVNFGDAETEVLSSARAAADEARVRQLSNEVDESQFDQRDDLETQRSDLDQRLSALRGRLVELTTTEAALQLSIASSLADLGHSELAIEAATTHVRDARRRSRIEGYDFSVTALDAYLGAEVLLSEARPGCNAQWWMIAGIARVESRHGELGGRTVSASGRTSTEIVGVVLDGGPGVRAVVDTDGGQLDGDPIWDRAVGPMQFIPGTWTIRGRDASGDGIADPHNLYDAAFSTGRYLCQLGGDLSLDSNLLDAYFGYNTSADYVAEVEHWATRYRQLQLDQSLLQDQSLLGG